MTEAVAHPAKYSIAVLAEIVAALDAYPIQGEILDPFAGVGKIHELRNWDYRTVGVELEEEWARTTEWTRVGDATDLPPDWRGRFGAVITSPPYGNRMADSYAGDAKGSRRHTYRVALGRPLTEGSAASMQWGPAYRETMVAFIREARRVLVGGGLFIVNISDHYRKGVLQHVPEWFETTIGSEGFQFVERRAIQTPRQRDGANANLRAECEWLLIFRKPSERTL